MRLGFSNGDVSYKFSIENKQRRKKKKQQVIEKARKKTKRRIYFALIDDRDVHDSTQKLNPTQIWSSG